MLIDAMRSYRGYSIRIKRVEEIKNNRPFAHYSWSILVDGKPNEGTARTADLAEHAAHAFVDELLKAAAPA